MDFALGCFFAGDQPLTPTTIEFSGFNVITFVENDVPVDVNIIINYNRFEFNLR